MAVSQAGFRWDLWVGKRYVDTRSVADATDAEPETQDELICTTSFRWPTKLLYCAIGDNNVKPDGVRCAPGECL